MYWKLKEEKRRRWMAINIKNSTGSHAELIVKLKEKSVTISLEEHKNEMDKWFFYFLFFGYWMRWWWWWCLEKVAGFFIETITGRKGKNITGRRNLNWLCYGYVMLMAVMRMKLVGVWWSKYYSFFWLDGKNGNVVVK